MMKKYSKRRCGSFRMSCILHTLRVLYDRETLVEPCYMSEKAYNCSIQELRVVSSCRRHPYIEFIDSLILAII